MSTVSSRASRKHFSWDLVISHRWLTAINVSVEYPEGHVDTLQTSEHVHVEQDGEVQTK